MRPSDFILNSDYLSIAQVSSNKYDITVGAGSLTVNNSSTQNFDFNTSAQTGIIDRVSISKDGGSFRIGSNMTFYPTWQSDLSNNVRGDLFVYRIDKTHIRVQIILQNYGTGTSTYPSMTFSIKVSSFRPPNVF